MARENGRALARDGVVELEAEQSECVSRDTIQRAGATVVVVLPPQPVVAAALPERGSRLARSLIPPALARPFAHRQSGEECPGRSPADVVRRVVDVPANKRVQVVRERWVGGQPECDEQCSGLARHERTGAVMSSAEKSGLARSNSTARTTAATRSRDDSAWPRFRSSSSVQITPAAPTYRPDSGSGFSRASQSSASQSAFGSNAASASATIAAIASSTRAGTHGSSARASNLSEGTQHRSDVRTTVAQPSFYSGLWRTASTLFPSGSRT